MKILIFTFLILIQSFSYGQKNETKKSFFENGIPTLDKNWSAEEYINSINKIIELSDKKILSLPDKNNGEEILLKITHYENYWFLQSNDFSEREKLIICQNILGTTNKLWLKYYQNYKIVNNKINYSSEIISIQLFSLKLTNKMLQIANQHAKENPNLTATQIDGLEHMKNGLNKYISVIFQILDKGYTAFQDEDICNLSSNFFEFYNINRNSLDDVSRKQFDNETYLLHKNHKQKCVQNTAIINF